MKYVPPPNKITFKKYKWKYFFKHFFSDNQNTPKKLKLKYGHAPITPIGVVGVISV